MTPRRPNAGAEETLDSYTNQAPEREPTGCKPMSSSTPPQNGGQAGLHRRRPADKLSGASAWHERLDRAFAYRSRRDLCWPSARVPNVRTLTTQPAGLCYTHPS